MGLVDKVKDAADAAAEKAAALRGQATSLASDLSEQAAAKASEVLDAGFGQVSQTVADFNAALPTVRQAGYALATVTVEVSISPKVVATFTSAEVVSDEKIERLLQEHAENKLAVMLIRTLRRAGKLQASMSVGSLQPRGLAISVGISPSIAIQFG